MYITSVQSSRVTTLKERGWRFASYGSEWDRYLRRKKPPRYRKYKKVEKAKCSHRTWRADFLVSKILEAGVLGLQLQVEELVKSWPISKLEEKILRFERLVQASTRLQSENQIDSMDF